MIFSLTFFINLNHYLENSIDAFLNSFNNLPSSKVAFLARAPADLFPLFN